MAICQY